MNWPDSTALLAPLGPWFEVHRRDMPWRVADLDRIHPDPYAVLVSELMLQQTQVATVLPYFARWMARFPDTAALSAASEDEIHKLWEGLGYYRRARYLHRSAQWLAAHGWPSDFDGLLKLPGLGPYTAAAVASIAFQWPEPALDGNAFRVLARLLGLESDPRHQAKALRAWLRPALGKVGPSRLTQGLMELGATICTPAPSCTTCPVAAHCRARAEEATGRIPVSIPRRKPKESKLWLLAVEAEGQLLLCEPAKRGLLAGLWCWPAIEMDELADESLAAESSPPYESSTKPQTWPGWTQVYTHRREIVTPLHLGLAQRFEASEGCRWVGGAELDRLALGKRDQRLRELIRGVGIEPLRHPPVARLLAHLQMLRDGAAPAR